MTIISRLFKRQHRSALEQFGDSLTPRAIAAAMRTNHSRNNRIAVGLATTDPLAGSVTA
jgi:hypothetical protein